MKDRKESQIEELVFFSRRKKCFDDDVFPFRNCCGSKTSSSFSYFPGAVHVDFLFDLKVDIVQVFHDCFNLSINLYLDDVFPFRNCR